MSKIHNFLNLGSLDKSISPNQNFLDFKTLLLRMRILIKIHYLEWSKWLILMDSEFWIFAQFQKIIFTQTIVCLMTLIRRAVQSPDPGASNGGSNFQIRHFWAYIKSFEVAMLPQNVGPPHSIWDENVDMDQVSEKSCHTNFYLSCDSDSTCAANPWPWRVQQWVKLSNPTLLGRYSIIWSCHAAPECRLVTLE